MPASEKAVIIILIVTFFIWILSLPGGQSAPPKPKDDPDKKEQRRLAHEMLSGKISPEEIAEKEGYDIEHIKKWKEEYLHAAEKDHNLRERLDID